MNTGRGRKTISLAVPGAQYGITAWALDDGRRSATPAWRMLPLEKQVRREKC